MDMKQPKMYKENMSYFRAIQVIQEALGPEKAKPVIEAFEAMLRTLEEKASEKEIQIKIEIVDQVKKELKEDLKEELVTKADLIQTESRLREEIGRLKLEMEKRFSGIEKRFSEIEKRFYHLYAILFVLGVLILGSSPLAQLLIKLLESTPK